MIVKRTAIAVLLLCLDGAGAAYAQTPNDYGAGASWLCRPGRQDACSINLDTTIVNADGTVAHEAWKGNPDAPIDCFYVYPTVSTDPTPLSDMTADPAELNVVRQQFARFGAVCRTYAPLYRQVTLAGLRRAIAGGGGGGSLSQGPQYDDVRDAWRYYLEHDNRGRGVVMIGHSQGSFILAELIRREVEGTPAQNRLVSAILLGATLSVPRGKDVGGTFKQIPLCRTPAQIGCLVTYVSYRATSPPPANTRFGRVADAETVAACTNPAALAGGSAPLRAYLAADGRSIVDAPLSQPSWVVPPRPIDTPWVSVPGLLSARCASIEQASYLEITVHGDPADPRADDIRGDLIVGNQVLTDWGLHLIDVNLGLGNLVDIVREQALGWMKRH